MSAAIKFCGLTRAEDVAEAKVLGAEYVGVVMAGGPRERSVDATRTLFEGTSTARRVGVVRSDAGKDFATIVSRSSIDIIQLHADPDASSIDMALVSGAAEVWPVVRVAGSDMSEESRDLFQSAATVVLDARSANGLGGSGNSFDWITVSMFEPVRRRKARLVIAGGLHAGNVAEAIRALAPDVVDVSSGVESSPGIKDHELMRRFVDAVRAA